jgi:hypothetical protein
MPADVTYAVAIGFGVLGAVLALAGVMLSRSAQRQGCETRLDLQFATYRLRFYCGPPRDCRTSRYDAPDATARQPENITPPSTPETSPPPEQA